MLPHKSLVQPASGAAAIRCVTNYARLFPIYVNLHGILVLLTFHHALQQSTDFSKYPRRAAAEASEWGDNDYACFRCWKAGSPPLYIHLQLQASLKQLRLRAAATEAAGASAEDFAAATFIELQLQHQSAAAICGHSP